MSERFADYHKAYSYAVAKANEMNSDVAIRRVKEYGKDGYNVSYASRNDSDYARAEIVKPGAIRIGGKTNMKMSENDFNILKNAIMNVLTANPEAQGNYKKKGLSDMRFRWDALHASKLPDGFITKRLYDYLNDDHIDTALRRAIKEINEELPKTNLGRSRRKCGPIRKLFGMCR